MFIAVIKHAGGMPGKDPEVRGETREKLLQHAQSEAFAGSYFVSYIMHLDKDQKQTVIWEESSGWLPKADQFFPPSV